jgi:glycopeptide antibiotics resistance protein
MSMSNVPWFWPGVLLSTVLGVAIATRLGRALGIPATLAGALVVTTGIIIAATLTPLRTALDSGAVGTGTCDFSRLGLAPLADLASRNDTSLNILLFIPLGAAIGLIGRSRVTAALTLAAIALPFAIETIQLLAPILARGCQSADVIDNLSGLTIGLVIGALFRIADGFLSRAH